MIAGLLKQIFGDKSSKDQKLYQPFVDEAKAHETALKTLNDDALRQKSFEFRSKIKETLKDLESESASIQEKIDHPDTLVTEKEELFNEMDRIAESINETIEEVLLQILPEAFAVIKETARRWAENKQLEVSAMDFDRTLAAQKDGITLQGDKAIWHNEWTAAGSKVTWNMVHYDVQLMGGSVLHKGNIAEMQTGEGKTLVATLPVYLNALSGKGVHVVTVNDYLAKRDSEWMGPLYQFHGLTVDCIDKHRPNSDQRRNAYLADITFGTNNEFGFDYLRDNMVSSPSEMVQRKHHFAIVDEVDSVLIDDARTPLIISGPTSQTGEQEFQALKPRIERIVAAQRELVQKLLLEAKKNLVVLNELEADKKLEKTMLEEGGIALLRAYRGLPKNKPLIKFLSEPGIKVHLQKTENYYMQEQGKRMKLIDEELYFTIDEKNNSIELTMRGIDLISGKDERDFFIMPDIGAEIAKLQEQGLSSEKFLEQKDALVRDYSIKSERIHSVNQLLKAYCLFEKEVEYIIVEGKVKIVDESTGRVLDGRRYSDGLHQAIEAKENVKIEAATQTYATITLQNYFRMYHKLAGMTGTAETEAKEFYDIYKLDVVVIPTHQPVRRKDLNDMVYKTVREKFGAVIEEVERLVAEGRPVLVGTTTVEISELLSKMLQYKKIPHQVLNAKYHQKEAEIVANAGKAGAVTIATNMAGRGTDIKLGEGVKEAGGLAIIGTERHDSRRVDRQLRGRSGRQGDPGSSQFFVSLEDDLMRKFGSERIAKIMDRMGLKEGEVISHSLVSKSIERAQKKVEENNFGIRKRLLEYDDVMNAQRKRIYNLRRNALYGDRLEIDVDNMFYDLCQTMARNTVGLDYLDYETEIIRVLGISSPIDEETFQQIDEMGLTESLYDAMKSQYLRKQERITAVALPQIKEVFETMSDRYKNMVFPLRDGNREFQLIVNLEHSVRTNGKEIIRQFEKNILLEIIDNEWKEHLREMDDLRSAVNNATYEQKDPLVIYKLESFNLFKEMFNRVNQTSVELLMKLDLPSSKEFKQTNQESQQNNYSNAKTNTSISSEIPSFDGNQSRSSSPIPQAPQEKRAPIIVDPKINRNDLCPCGSGKKFKQCHGK